MGIYVCEEHYGVFVYESHHQVSCPLCSDIEGLNDEIKELQEKVESLKEE